MATKVGDRIIVWKANGKFDILKINELGESEQVRAEIAPLQQAYEIALGSLASGGQVWEQPDETTPDVIRPYRTGYPWGNPRKD
jgi:hypothetical protein